jgi:hypothetical protein
MPISAVRSTRFDEFTLEELEWIESQGNMQSALLNESALPPTVRRPAAGVCPEAVRRYWMRQKYHERLFTGQPTDALLPHETLSGWLEVRELDPVAGGNGATDAHPGEGSPSGASSDSRRTPINQSARAQSSFAPSKSFGASKRPATPVEMGPRSERCFVCIRNGAQLCMYADETASDAVLRGVLPLAGATLTTDPATPTVLKLRSRGAALLAANGGELDVTIGSALLLRAPADEEAEQWLWALYQCAHGAEVRAQTQPELTAVLTPAHVQTHPNRRPSGLERELDHQSTHQLFTQTL